MPYCMHLLLSVEGHTNLLKDFLVFPFTNPAQETVLKMQVIPALVLTWEPPKSKPGHSEFPGFNFSRPTV